MFRQGLKIVDYVCKYHHTFTIFDCMTSIDSNNLASSLTKITNNKTQNIPTISNLGNWELENWFSCSTTGKIFFSTLAWTNDDKRMPGYLTGFGTTRTHFIQNQVNFWKLLAQFMSECDYNLPCGDWAICRERHTSEQNLLQNNGKWIDVPFLSSVQRR